MAAAAAAPPLPPEARQLLTRKAQRAAYCKAWRAVLSLPLRGPTFRRALRCLPEHVFPHVPRPVVYCDLLSDGYARGGLGAVLALKGLFVLMVSHNLEYPRFYPRLYKLLTRDNLCGPHRAAFADELRRFLSSSGLPAYLLAAFAKRLGRLALEATPAGAALALALVYNLMLQHPASRVLVHRSSSGGGEEDEEAGAEDKQRVTRGTRRKRPRRREAEGAASSSSLGGDAALVRAAAAADPFDGDAEEPEGCRAIDSSLWEVDQLRSHCCPTVASLAGLFSGPMGAMAQPVDLEPLAALSYASIGQLETRKKLREVPLAVRAPAALFGADPSDSLHGSKLVAGLGSWR